MNRNVLSEALTGIDAAFIEEAASLAPVIKKRTSRRAAAGIAAAAVALLLLPAALVPALSRTDGADAPNDSDFGGASSGQEGNAAGTPQESAAMQLFETRTVPGGTLTYLARTPHSVTLRFEKTDDRPVYFTLKGRRDGKTYFATTDPSSSDMGTPDAVFTFFINGEEGPFPAEAGTYEVVVDFTPLCALCDTLGPLQSTLADFALE